MRLLECFATSHYSVQLHSILFYSVVTISFLCGAVLCCAALCWNELYCTVLYCTAMFCSDLFWFKYLVSVCLLISYAPLFFTINATIYARHSSHLSSSYLIPSNLAWSHLADSLTCVLSDSNTSRPTTFDLHDCWRWSGMGYPYVLSRNRGDWMKDWLMQCVKDWVTH